MAIGVHMCRGNAMGKWMASGGYERIAEEAFGALEVDAFFLEYDTARAGGFEPLRFVPAGKFVVLGLVSTKTPHLESADDLKRGSTRRRATCRSNVSDSARSAASRAAISAPRSPSPTKKRSSG